MANVSNVMMGLVVTFLGFGILVFVLSLTGSMMAELLEQQCETAGGTVTSGVCSIETSVAVNATNDGLEGIATASGFSPLISLAIVIGAIVTILLVFIGGALIGSSRA